LLSEPGGSGARFKEGTRALLLPHRIGCRRIDDKLQMRALRVVVWPDFE